MDDAQSRSLQRFVDAQERVWERVTEELITGYKTSHWMWFVFPQLRGLGSSPEAQFYGLSGLDEARDYLAHSLLGDRLRWSAETLLGHAARRTPRQMLGEIDALKLCSSLTLFAQTGDDALFDRALAGLFAGERDPHTLALLERPSS